MSDCSELVVVPLTYTVAGCSEHSRRFGPENILVDNPMDQASRWSSAYQASDVKKWVLLELNQLSVLRTLTFGKHHRAHPCTMREFKVFVGESEESMVEILRASLRNDHIPETFSIRHLNNTGVPFPTRVDLFGGSAQGQSYHPSIWHVKIMGITDEKYVEEVRIHHNSYKESMILRYILKHLRQRRLLTPYHSILSRTEFDKDPFEHPSVTSLHTAIVLQGNFSEAESLLQDCATNDLFSSSILSVQPTSAWSIIKPSSNSAQPSARGGHGMCIDQTLGHIYMFGGWDGKKSLHDLWMWSIGDMKWTYLGSDGPAPRACHKMVFDDRTGDVFLLGRLDENVSTERAPSPGDAPRTEHHTTSEPPIALAGPNIPRGHTTRPLPSRPSTFCAEFYRYHTRGPQAGSWDLISPDTTVEGGPPLVYDHQMVIDSEKQMIYVLGGRVIDGDWNSAKYAGFYSYNIQMNKWTLLRSTDTIGIHPSIAPRFGHSMVLDVRIQTLFIFAGQREGKYLADMYTYHIPTDSITEIYSNFAASDGPKACFTQRAAIDPDLKEIYVICGLCRGPPGSLGVLEHEAPYWTYRYDRPDRPGVWTKILPPSSTAPGDVPLPRYAHQIVYDSHSKTLYMHGGNAGGEQITAPSATEDVVMARPEESTAEEGNDGGGEDTRFPAVAVAPPLGGEDAEMDLGGNDTDCDRLDDFWSLQFQRPSASEMVRRGKYLIRQQQFRELCEDASPVQALAYLQTEVSSVVNHSDSAEAQVFRSLLSYLLTPSVVVRPTPAPAPQERQDSSVQKRKRSSDEPDEGGPARPSLADEAIAHNESLASKNTSVSPRPVVSYEPDEGETSVDGRVQPSSRKFKQRTELFESLTKLVNADAKQPEQDLWNVIDVDQLELGQ